MGKHGFDINFRILCSEYTLILLNIFVIQVLSDKEKNEEYKGRICSILSFIFDA